MPIIDVILLVALFGFVFYGLFFGFIRAFGAFVGVIIGAILASRLYLPVAAMVEPLFFGLDNLGKVFVFLILFSIFNRLTGFGFYLVEKAFNLISIIPFLKTLNRLLGAVFGFLTGALAIGLILFVISRYAILDSLMGVWLLDSRLAPWFLKFSEVLLPLLPEVLKKLKSLI